MSTDRFFQSVSLSDVVLRVGDLSRVRSFYRDALGMRVVSERVGRSALSATGEGPALIVLEEDRAAPIRPRTASGLFHAAILYPSRASLGRIARTLLAQNVDLATGDHGVSEALYLDDPEGNGIELYADRPIEAWPPPAPGEKIAMYTEAVDLAGLLAEADSAAGPLMPTSTRLGHVHLSVADLGSTERFYHQLLGFDVTVRNLPGALFFGRDGYHHHLGTNTWRSRTPVVPGTRGLVRFTMCFSDEKKIARIGQQLGRPGGKSGDLVLKDPSGIEIVLTTANAVC